MKNSKDCNLCMYCDAEVDEGDSVCCLCIDDTEGRNQDFWKKSVKLQGN